MGAIENSARSNPLTEALAEVDTDSDERAPVSGGTTVVVRHEAVHVLFIDEGMAYVSRSPREEGKVEMRVPLGMVERAVAQLWYVKVISHTRQ